MLQFANHYVEVYWHMIEGTKIKWRNMGKRLVAHCVTIDNRIKGLETVKITGFIRIS